MKKTSLAALIALSAVSAAAHTIYPIDRATIMAGSLFDVKIEFDQQVAEKDVQISLNGEALGEQLGGTREFVAQEDGKAVSSLWIRGAALHQAGDYRIQAQAGGNQADVQWSVYETPAERKAKNVILFIGDGLSVAHRTGARILSQGVTEGKANGKLAMDSLPYMGFIGTSSTDSIATDSANTMSAYMTGHKSAVNALGVYSRRSEKVVQGGEPQAVQSVRQGEPNP